MMVRIHLPDESFPVVEPVELEIGFGRGDFLDKVSALHPHITYVGVDRSWGSVKRAHRRLKDRENVHLVWGDVWEFLMFGLRGVRFHRVFSLFPDPWPKRRHERRRMFNEDFWKLLSIRTKEDAHVSVVSDERFFVRWAYDNAISAGCWWGYVSYTERRFGTKYEERWLREGKRVYQAVLLKDGECSFRIPETTLRIPKIKSVSREVKPGHYPLPDGSHLSVKEVVVDRDGDKMLIRAVISEGYLLHKVWFVVFRRGDVWYVEPSRFSRFFPTEGLQHALDLLAEMLSGRTRP
ncbi:MAG: hypothetical protein GXO29_06970 [Thermotogae bacterium]|nr:hypothetical protein [Thermotogota bacterium]